MKSDYGEIQKVTLEFENKIITLSGDDAKQWKRIVDSQATLAHVHGSKTPALNWQEENK